MWPSSSMQCRPTRLWRSRSYERHCKRVASSGRLRDGCLVLSTAVNIDGGFKMLQAYED
jgi:hypothetical protein